MNDLQIAGRALGFLDKPLQGEIAAGIVYAPKNPQSTREAEALKDMLGDGLRIGNVTLKPILIPVGEVEHAKAALFLLTGGVDDASLVADAARGRGIPCITTDLARVKSGAWLTSRVDAARYSQQTSFVCHTEAKCKTPFFAATDASKPCKQQADAEAAKGNEQCRSDRAGESTRATN